VQQLAKEIGVEGGVRTVAFGVEDESHLAEIYQALSDCIESGCWFVLQNIHLATGLCTSKLLHLLQVRHVDWTIGLLQVRSVEVEMEIA